jgi:nucleoside-diphosphate-sugar epimerase
MPLNGDGGQTRDFTYVGDVVAGLIAASSAPGVSGGVYNLAGGRRVSVEELGRMLARLAGREARFERRPARPGDIRDSFACTEALRRDVGFVPPTALEEGLARTLGGAGR